MGIIKENLNLMSKWYPRQLDYLSGEKLTLQILLRKNESFFILVYPIWMIKITLSETYTL